MTADRFNANIRKKKLQNKSNKEIYVINICEIDTGLLTDVIANNLDRRAVELE